jgi:hypothetical protein
MSGNTRQNEIANKIRLFRVMLNNPEYGTITSDLSSAIWKMEKELIDSIHTSAVTAPTVSTQQGPLQVLYRMGPLVIVRRSDGTVVKQIAASPIH